MKKELISEINSNNKEKQTQDIPYVQKIKNLMEYIITQNNKNKKIKMSLYIIRGFDPSSIFYEIDTISSGFINQRDLVDYLSENNIKKEKDIIKLFIREYNKEENDNTLSIQDFIKFINFDIDKSLLNLGVLNYNKNEIKKLFLKLIESELNIIKEKNLLISEIIKIREFSTFEAFYKISNEKNYIDLDSLKVFLDNKFNNNEVKELIYRIDMNNDGKITYEEFQDLFFPFQKHLHLGEKIETDLYNYIDDNNYDIVINYNDDYNLNPYKDGTLIEPKIIQTYYDKKKGNIDKDSKSKIILSESPFNQNNLKDENNFNYENNNDMNNNNYSFKIKYDEKLFNEINDRIEGRIKNEDDSEFNKNNDKNNHDINKSEKINTNLGNIDIHSSKIFFGDEEDENSSSSETFLGKARDINIFDNIFNGMNSNQDENTDSKFDKNTSKQYLDQNNNYNSINDNNINNINDKNHKQNFEDESKGKEIQNFNEKNISDTLTEKEKNIINLFIDFIYLNTSLENKTESLRESITLCDDMSLLDIFETFDKNKDNSISKTNFIDVCNREYIVFPTETQVKLIYDRYDLDKDGELNFDEFMKMIKPLKKEYLDLYNKDENDKENKMLSFESKKKVIHFLKALLDNETFINDLKSKLNSDKNFNFIELWGILMKYSNDNQKLTKEEFNNFLENFGCYLTQNELDIIFFKLSNDNEVINYDDLYKKIII